MKVLFDFSRSLISPQLSSSNNMIDVEDFLVISQSYNNVISGSSTSMSASQDSNYSIFSNAISQDLFNLGTNISLTSTTSPIYINYNPSILSINSNGNTTWVSNGTASINVKYNRRTRNVNISSYQSPPSVNKSLLEYITGSIAASISSSTSNLINGLIASGATYNIYSSINDGTFTYIRNTSSWANSIDFTCIPIYGTSQNKFNGVLVSPDIMITANHIAQRSGLIYFVDKNNTTVSSSVVSGSQLGNTDIWVNRIYPPITGSIIPAKVLHPSTFSGSTVKVTLQAIDGNKIPVVVTNQFRTLRIKVGYRLNSNDNAITNPIASSSLQPWTTTIVNGDSGSPYFVLINGQVVVLGTWFTAGGGPSISFYFNQINSIITTLSSSNFLITSSLSGFSSY